jgi:xanthine dehydrogenase accessory factor
MSKEIQNILAAYQPNAQAYALATVVYVEGSSYRRMGARMLVGEDGQFVGGISGGCLEGDALKRARMAILTDKPSIIRYDTSQDDAHQIGVGLGCNGIIDVLFKPINPEDPQNIINLLGDRQQSTRQTTSYITVTKSPDKLLLGNIYNVSKTLPYFLSNFQLQINGITQTQILNLSNDTSVFYEILPPPIHIYIYGHQYDIYPLIQLIQYIGWEYTVIASVSKLKSNVNHLEPDHISSIKFDNYSVALVMSHDYKADKQTLTHLANHQIPPSDKTLHYPMGLDLGSQSPEEIALSIIAEIKSVFSNRPGSPLKLRQTPIYDRS